MHPYTLAPLRTLVAKVHHTADAAFARAGAIMARVFANFYSDFPEERRRSPLASPRVRELTVAQLMARYCTPVEKGTFECELGKAAAAEAQSSSLC